MSGILHPLAIYRRCSSKFSRDDSVEQEMTEAWNRAEQQLISPSAMSVPKAILVASASAGPTHLDGLDPAMLPGRSGFLKCG